MLTETIRAYKHLTSNIDAIIKASGYKLEFLQREMNMDRVTFYRKRKKGTFTADEIERLFEIMDVDRLEDRILAKLSEEGEKSGFVEL